MLTCLCKQAIEYCKDGKLCYTESKLLAENHPFIHQRMFFSSFLVERLAHILSAGIAGFREHRQQFEATHATSTVTPAFEYPKDYIDLVVALTQDR